MSKPIGEEAIVVGISGPSSSGKTTLARLLQRVFFGVNLKKDSRLNTFIIHEDDFYFPDDKYVHNIHTTMAILTTPESHTQQPPPAKKSKTGTLPPQLTSPSSHKH
jgi:nicotinamide/nicotinate riboside kinase